jgi:parallel beta-helix repeat protein
MTIGAVIFALAAVGAMLLGGGRASASHVGCGDIITADTTLDSDLLNCPNNGIVIGADGITLDLNGHVIDGDGTEFAACGPREDCDFGVLNDGHDGVTVMHGSVHEFEAGMYALKGHPGGAHGVTRHYRVLGISASRNRFAGIVFQDAARSLVRNSSGSGSVIGMGLFGSDHVRILHNSFRHNSDHGLFVEESTNNVISGNLFLRDEGAISLIDSDRNEVRRNRCFRNNTCILVGPGNQNVIARNRAFRDVAGIWIENGRGNLVARNAVVGAREVGVRLGSAEPPIGGSSNVVRRNLVRGSGSDGFRVDRKDDHSLLRRNLTVGAGDDGFDVRSRTAKLTGNRALRNADLGIDAVRGVIDGGGNRASGNGDPRQCVNVTCD